MPKREHQLLEVLSQADVFWPVNFKHDTLYYGRRFRTLNVLDEGERETLDIEIDTSLSGERLVRVMERISSWRGPPAAIRRDNGRN